MMQLPPQTHEDASEGASEKNRYRNTSDLPTKFSERMRAAMFPRQNLKRREAAFCWARRRFAPAKCRNALLLSSKSTKLSFSQEKLLTAHYHEPTHTPSMDMRERSGSHLRERRRGKRPQRRYDQSHDRDGTAGVPSTQPALVREPTSAFSSWGRLVLSSMLDAEEQGRERPED